MHEFLDDAWDAPLRLLGGIHYLALERGEDPWREVSGFVAENRERLAEFARTRSVQTNEVQRSWALLPAFLSLGERRLDLVELGPSAGLNLVFDRYRYRYAAGGWGEAGAVLELTGEERAAVPAELLARDVEVARRRGIDLDPIDVTTDEGARLLESFVWADQTRRRERLRRAIEALRPDPPELIRGDYVDELPRVLRERTPGALTVVFQTASTPYLSQERYDELLRALAEADTPLAWISTRRFSELETGREDGYELEVALWPERGPRRVAHMGFHGHWLEWVG